MGTAPGVRSGLTCRCGQSTQLCPLIRLDPIGAGGSICSPSVRSFSSRIHTEIFPRAPLLRSAAVDQ